MARDIRIRITGDSSSLKSAFGDAEKAASGFSSKIGGILGGIAKGGALLAGGGIAAAVPLLTDAVGRASDFNETISKTQTIFGEASSSLFAWADDAAKTMGQSRQQALDAAGTFGMFGQAAGLGGEDLVGFTKNLTGLSSDLASFYNSDPQAAIEAIGAALRGESEPIRQFGVMLSEDTLKATALSKGLVKAEVDVKKLSKAQETSEKAGRKVAEALAKYGANSVQYTDAVRDHEQAEREVAAVLEGKVPQLTQAQKMQAAYAAIMDQTTVAQGDFARTSDGLANKQRILAAEWANSRQELGQAFLPVAMKVADFMLHTFLPRVQQFTDWVQHVAGIVKSSGWGAAFREVVDEVGGVIGSLASRAWEFLSGNLPGWLDSFGQWFAGTAAPWLGERAKELGGKIAELTRFAWDFLKANLPTWLNAFGAWFTETAVPWVVEKVEAIASAVAGWVPQAWEKTVEKLNEYLKKLEEWFKNDGAKGGEEGGQSVTEGVIRGLGKLWLSTQTVLAEWQGKVAHWFFTEGVPTFVKGADELLIQARLTMAAGVMNLVKASFRIGQDIVAGFIDGILNMADELQETITRFIWAPVKEARKLLGISSPSKVFAIIGGQIAQGLAIGLDAGGTQVAAASTRLAESSMVGFGGIGLTPPAPAGTFARGPLPGTAVRPAGFQSPRGFGDEGPGSGLTLSASEFRGGGNLNLTINGVIGDHHELARFLAEVLRRYGYAVAA